MDILELKKIKDLLLETAITAGNFISAEAEKFSLNQVEYKDVNNVVSYVDKQAEKIIVDALSSYSSKIGFITEEETAGTVDLGGFNWIIDPLDGTANFVHGLPHYSVSVALAKGQEVLVGVIYHIPLKLKYWAIKDHGAYNDKKKLIVSNTDKLGETLLATGFPYYKFEEMPKYLKILEVLMQNSHGLRRFGSAALDLAYVAEGIYDGFFEYNLNSYDMAAGVLLVKEAGGTVCDFSGGQDFLFGGDVVAAGKCHEDLLKVIVQNWKNH